MSDYRKKLAGNFVYLSIVQGLSILFPLITFPYLLRVLGVENFGVFTLIQTFLMYCDLLVTFGFSLTATQYVSTNLNDKEKINELISAVYLIKSVLFLLSFLICLICSLFIPYLRENILMLLVSSFYLFGNLLLPDWYFQGIQKMRNITIAAFSSKLISLILIIWLVKTKTDIFYAILAISAGNLIAGLIGVIMLLTHISIKPVLPSRAFLKALFKESGYVFTSVILAPLYSSVNLFILQVFTNPLMVGYYAISEKIYSAIGMLTSIANRTFFPHLAQLYETSREAYKRHVKRIAILLGATFLVFAIALFFGAPLLIELAAGKKQQHDISYSIQILRIMSISLPVSPFVSFFFQVMILQNQKKRAIKNILITIGINFILGSAMAYLYAGTGMAIGLCVIVYMIAFLNFAEANSQTKIFNRINA